MLRQGEPAPFAGQLLSNDVAVDLGLSLESCRAKLELEKEYCRKREQYVTTVNAATPSRDWVFLAGAAGFVFGVLSTVATVWAVRN